MRRRRGLERLRGEIERELAELDAEAELGLIGDDEYELRSAELEAWLYALEEERRKKRRGRRSAWGWRRRARSLCGR